MEEKKKVIRSISMVPVFSKQDLPHEMASLILQYGLDMKSVKKAFETKYHYVPDPFDPAFYTGLRSFLDTQLALFHKFPMLSDQPTNDNLRELFAKLSALYHVPLSQVNPEILDRLRNQLLQRVELEFVIMKPSGPVRRKVDGRSYQSLKMIIEKNLSGELTHTTHWKIFAPNGQEIPPSRLAFHLDNREFFII